MNEPWPQSCMKMNIRTRRPAASSARGRISQYDTRDGLRHEKPEEQVRDQRIGQLPDGAWMRRFSKPLDHGFDACRPRARTIGGTVGRCFHVAAVSLPREPRRCCRHTPPVHEKVRGSPQPQAKKTRPPFPVEPFLFRFNPRALGSAEQRPRRYQTLIRRRRTGSPVMASRCAAALAANCSWALAAFRPARRLSERPHRDAPSRPRPAQPHSQRPLPGRPPRRTW